MTNTTSPILDTLSTHDSHLLLEPEVGVHELEHDDLHDEEIEHFSDGDTASQRSISLSSPPRSPRTSTADASLDIPAHDHTLITPVALVRQGLANANRESHTYTLDTDFSSEHDFHDDDDDRSSFMRRLDGTESPLSSVAPSLHEDHDKENVGLIEKHPLANIKTSELKETVTADAPPEVEVTEEELEREGQDVVQPLPSASSRQSLSAGSRSSVASFVSLSSYPPPPRQSPDPRASVASFASSSTSYSKKVRPESMLVTHSGPLVLGIALVDFNHLVGPTIEFSRGALFEDEEIAKILPFLALPDGAHLVRFMISIFRMSLLT